jgi:hypothetical protein
VYSKTRLGGILENQELTRKNLLGKLNVGSGKSKISWKGFLGQDCASKGRGSTADQTLDLDRSDNEALIRIMPDTFDLCQNLPEIDLENFQTVFEKPCDSRTQTDSRTNSAISTQNHKTQNLSGKRTVEDFNRQIRGANLDVKL